MEYQFDIRTSHPSVLTNVCTHQRLYSPTSVVTNVGQSSTNSLTLSVPMYGLYDNQSPIPYPPSVLSVYRSEWDEGNQGVRRVNDSDR